MTQFLRDQASDSEKVVTPLMLDGTYLSRNFATLRPLPDKAAVRLQNKSRFNQESIIKKFINYFFPFKGYISIKK